MKLNRRNVLIGLATATVGGGAAFGSGAFSTVEADRTVSIETTGDASALLSFDASGATNYNGATADTSTGDTLVLNFTDLNADAVTQFNGLLTITNNGNNDVDLQANPSENLSFLYDASGDGNKNTTLSSTATTLTANGGNVVLDVEVDLKGQDSTSSDETVTFTATDTSA